MQKKISLVVLLFLSAVLLITAGRFLLASVWDNQVDSFLGGWQQQGGEPSRDAWQVAHDAANTAISISPIENASYYNHLGRVWEWQQFSKPFGHPAAIESRQQALVAYRQAIQLRPQWPYSWLSLASTKLRLLQLDEEFMHALQMAAQLAPWRLTSNKQVAEIGLMTWFDLDQATKQTVTTAIKRTVGRSSAAARWLENKAKDSNQLLIFCAALTQQAQAKLKHCAT